MLPEITDALIARIVQTPRMAEAGRAYWVQRRVSDLTIAAGRGFVRARVRGSETAPYAVTVQFADDARAIPIARCTCPVESGCKHAAAVLFALRAELADAAQTSKPGRTAPLPPALTQWMTAMRPLLRVADPGAVPAPRAICYIVRAQAMAGTSRSGAKRPAASLAPPGSPLRLSVEIVDVPLDAAGVPNGAGAKVPAYRFGDAAGGAPGYATLDDRLIVRRLHARIGDVDGDGCLTGAGGGDLLRRMIAGGRARFGGVRGAVLRLGEPIALGFDWRRDAAGQARLAIASGDGSGFVGLSAPPLLIDPASGIVRPIESGVAPDLVEQLLRMPPIPIDAVPTMADRWGELAPPGVPPPPLLDIRDLGIVAPVPVVTLMLDKVAVMEPGAHRWSYPRSVARQTALVRLSFAYGAATVDATTTDRRVLIREEHGYARIDRDPAAEAAAIERLTRCDLLPLDLLDEVEATDRQVWDFAVCVPARPDDYAWFLAATAPALRTDGWRVELAPGLPLRIVPAPPDSLAVAVTPTGIDWFDVALGITIDGERIDLVPALRRLLATIDPGDVASFLDAAAASAAVLPVALGDGRIVTIDAARILPMLRALLLLASNAALSGGADRPGFAPHDLGVLAALDAATADLPWQGGDALRRLAHALTDLQFAPTPVPPSFKAALRPYQQTGLDWLDALGRAGLGGLLADDMGLGKTIQTLAHVAVLKARGALDRPVLIVAPTSVLPNWQAEAARFAPDLALLVRHGAQRHHRHAESAGHDIVLTSYPLLIRDRAALAREGFALAVFDEAHNLKNPRTAGHHAAKAIVADRKLALTGTPVENRLADAWALFDLLVPGLLGDRRSFARNISGPIEADGDATAKAHLARKLKPFLLRRTKAAVATELPRKSIVPLMITLAPAQMALHESQRLVMQARVRDEIARVGLMRAQIVVLAALTRLRQICCDPRLIASDGTTSAPSAKLDRLFELLDEMIPEGRRIILFSQFTTMLDLIKPELDTRGIAWVEITGRTGDRITPVARFQAGEVPIILISLKAGGTGLNLTAADTVILYDPWWNPAIEAQAIDRAHRIGQTKVVFVYRMVAAGTIEDKILLLQQRKAALAEALWSDDPATPTRLEAADIAFLLG